MSLTTKNNVIFKWLKKPYYFNEQLNFRLFVSFGMGTFVALFFAILKPLYINEFIENVPLYSFFCGIIVTVVLLFYFFFIVRSFPSFFNKSSWNIGRHVSTVIFLMFLCSFSIWVYNQYTPYGFLEGDKSTLLELISYILRIGIFPLVVYLLIDERYATYHKNLILKEIKETQEIIPQKKRKKKYTNSKVTIYASNNKDYLSFDIKDIVYITSQANYASFFLKNDKGFIREKIVRTQLQKVEKELEKYTQIIRCHKSYIINTRFLQNITGNARGYYLQLQGIKKEIPVSRRFKKKELISLINS